MLKFIYISLLSCVVFIPLTACKSGVPKDKKKVVVDPNQQSEFDNLVSAIDASPASDSSVSLRFENNEFQRKQLSLFLYENIGCTKWVLDEEKKMALKELCSFILTRANSSIQMK